MSIEESLVLEMFSTVSFSNEEISLIESKFNKITLKKGEVLISPNSFVKNQYYIYSGCLRSYVFHKSGKDYTLQFAIKDWWISDYTALFASEKPTMNIECIQDAIVYSVSQEDLEKLYLLMPKLETFVRKKLERAYAGFQKRIFGYLSKSAKERYVTFIKTYPNIEQNVKNYHIASYLGITTESLSRIRKTLAEN